MANKIVHFCRQLLEKAVQKYGQCDSESVKELILSQTTADIFEEKLNDFLGLIEQAVLSPSVLHVSETLDIENEGERLYDDDELSDEESSERNLSQNSSQGSYVCVIERNVYSLEKMKNVVKFFDSCKNKKLQQTSRRYSFVKDYKIIHRFRDYIANGLKREKLNEMEEHVINKFETARASLVCVTERDIRRWAMIKARELNLEFSASPRWLHLFKKRNRIVSRKITKFTTVKEIGEQGSLEAKAKEFVENVKWACSEVPTKCIYNFDQSGFNYEHSNNRTLSHKGEKQTVGLIKSKHATSHSYSIMPLLSMSGQLAPKLHVCLQEKHGELGPRVLSLLDIPSNIYLTCSRSGKLDKSIMREWVSGYVAELSDKKSGLVLIYDSWTGQTDQKLYDGIKNLHGIYQIPAKTTNLAQPLDVYFFRQYKIIRRRIFDRIMLDDIPVDLHDRKNVLKMHSLIYNQLEAPIFTPMLCYSWFACGYTGARPGHFMNVNEVMFDDTYCPCDVDECENESFVRCSHCREYFCIRHFFVDCHFHKV